MIDNPTFSESVHGTGQQGDSPHFIVSGDRSRRPGTSTIPAIGLGIHLSSVHVSTYLTADEAALLGKTLLDAARFAHRVDDLEVIADLAAGDAA